MAAILQDSAAVFERRGPLARGRSTLVARLTGSPTVVNDRKCSFEIEKCFLCLESFKP